MDTVVARLIRRLLGRDVPALPRVSHSARVLPAYAALARHERNPVQLEPRLRMLVAQLAAERSRCRWCIDKGRHLWREAQLPLDVLRELSRFETSALFSTRERAALRFAEALTRYSDTTDGDGVSLESLAAVRQHLTEPEVAAVTAAVAEQHFFNPITGELGADAEPRARTPRSAWGAPLGSSMRSFWL